MLTLNIDRKIEYNRYKLQLVLCFVIATLVPVLIIGLILYQNSLTIITRKMSQYSMAKLTQTEASVQLKLAEFENISAKLFINNKFGVMLENYVNTKKNAGILPNSGTIKSYFNEYMISNQDIFAFMFICTSDKTRSLVVAKDDYPGFVDLVSNFTSHSTYRNIVKAGGGIVWSSPINIDRSHFVILGRYIKVLSTGEPLGVLAIVIDEDKIDQLANMTIYNHISLDEIENYSIIINNNGEIVSTPFKEAIGKNIAVIMRGVQPLKSLFDSVSNRDYGNEISQGSFITEVNQKQTLVTFKTIGSKSGVGGKSGWHLLNFALTSYLYAEIRTVGLTTLLLGLGFVVFSVFISFYAASFVCQKPKA